MVVAIVLPSDPGLDSRIFGNACMDEGVALRRPQGHSQRKDRDFEGTARPWRNACTGALLRTAALFRGSDAGCRVAVFNRESQDIIDSLHRDDPQSQLHLIG